MHQLSNFLQKFIDLLLYGNFFIAFCAVAMTWQTEYLLYGVIKWSPLTSFIFFSTLFLYAIHRIVGLVKVKPFLEKYRYSIINEFKNHIKIYVLIGGIGALYFFFQLSFANQILLIIPTIVSFGYVLPIVSRQKRLRDFDYIKIFLIAMVWAVITVLMPILERTSSISLSPIFIFLERLIFIFGITLPFDIRDLKVDKHIAVKTIPSIIGIQKTKWLAFISFCLVFLMALANWYVGFYSIAVLVGILVSCISSFLLVYYCDKTEEDYFFTGLMDGTMILQFGLIMLMTNGI